MKLLWLAVVLAVPALGAPASLELLPTYVAPRRVSEHCLVYPDNTRVSYVAQDFSITLAPPQGQELKGIFRTDRGIEERIEFGTLSPHLIKHELLCGRKILDLACGNGKFVRELVARGYDAYGNDLYLTEQQFAEGRFVASKMTDTGLMPEQFDAIFEANSGLSWNTATVEDTLLEGRRLLRPGGIIIVGVSSRQDLTPMVADIAGLRMFATVPITQHASSAVILRTPDP